MLQLSLSPTVARVNSTPLHPLKTPPAPSAAAAHRALPPRAERGPGAPPDGFCAAAMPGGLGTQAGGARGLYRRILLLHRALPPALRELGDRYVKEEFRKHKAAGPAEAQRFLREWEASAR